MFALNNTIKIKTTTFARIIHNVQKLTANTQYQIRPTTKEYNRNNYNRSSNNNNSRNRNNKKRRTKQINHEDGRQIVQIDG